MPKYLFEGSYTAEGAKGLAKEGGSSRRKAVEEMVKNMGGNVESFYYSFGAADVYLIVEVPDVATALAISMTVNQSGAVVLKSNVLIDIEDMDLAVQKSPNYRAPGQ